MGADGVAIPDEGEVVIVAVAVVSVTGSLTGSVWLTVTARSKTKGSLGSSSVNVVHFRLVQTKKRDLAES